MNTAIAVANQQFVAVTPTELIPAQRELADWCQRKIHALAVELREQQGNLRQAKTMKWRHSGWVSAVRKTKQRMIYYAKIKLAVAAGYLVVPNFDVDVIAVRVARSTPPDDRHGHTQTLPEVLPPGTGRYVDDVLSGWTQRNEYKRSDGTVGKTEIFRPTDYDESIDFPVQLVKPAILKATDRAMALKVFDRIGIVRGKKRSDPIVVGQIIDPKGGNRYGTWRNNPKCVTFFVAWWLDTRDLE